jgi:hypothetical protein
VIDGDERAGAVRFGGDSPTTIETITARCAANSKPAGERRCKQFKMVRVLVLDQNYVPRTLPLQTQPKSSLTAGETKVFKLAQT